METRLLVAYALMFAMALAVAAIGFRLWYNTDGRTVARQRLRDVRRHRERLAEREAAAREG